ncbi:hypothetical protein J31TS6_03770 [Brevibacillus reuszeri]|nr:hypothetical protein J31TS6_03770 [Brevibacillus reuszeri]
MNINVNRKYLQNIWQNNAKCYPKFFVKLGRVSDVPKEIDRPSKGMRSTVPGVVLQYGSFFSSILQLPFQDMTKTQPVFWPKKSFSDL